MAHIVPMTMQQATNIDNEQKLRPRATIMGNTHHLKRYGTGRDGGGGGIYTGYGDSSAGDPDGSGCGYGHARYGNEHTSDLGGGGSTDALRNSGHGFGQIIEPNN